MVTNPDTMWRKLPERFQMLKPQLLTNRQHLPSRRHTRCSVPQVMKIMQIRPDNHGFVTSPHGSYSDSCVPAGGFRRAHAKREEF